VAAAIGRAATIDGTPVVGGAIGSTELDITLVSFREES
jgi:hypothetical protein